MSFPGYAQLDLHMSRPYQQIDMSYLMFPSMFYPNQYGHPPALQPGQLQMQQYPQQLLRLPGVGDLFGSFPTPALTPYASHLYVQLSPTSLVNSTSSVSNVSAALLNIIPEALYPKYIQLLQLPIPGQQYAFLYTQLPLIMGGSVKMSPASYPSPGSEKPTEIPKSTNSNPHSIDYSSLVSYTVSPLSRRRRRHDPKSTYDGAQVKHTCTKCGKTFQKPYNLKSHMKTHSLERPFKCLVCPKTFARSHDRKRHELLHEGVKSFKCEGYLKDGKTKWGCGKTFARSDALARHFRTETGLVCIKPFMDEAK